MYSFEVTPSVRLSPNARNFVNVSRGGDGGGGVTGAGAVGDSPQAETASTVNSTNPGLAAR